jgi:hypothetical protein
MNIKTADVDQECRNDRVDETVVFDIVHVAKDVVVFPSGRDREKVPILVLHCFGARRVEC